MEIDKIVNTFRNCGFKITKIYGYYFLNRGWINYSFPLLSEIRVNRSLTNSIKWKFLLSVIRIESRKKNTYEYILKTDDYSLDIFNYSAKKKIKKSIRECIYKRPAFEDLVNFGLKINRQAICMQKRKDRTLTNFRNWEKHISSLYNDDNTIILGAFINERMIAYIIAYKFEGKYFNYLKHFDREFGVSAPMQGLIFTMVNQIIAKEGKIELSDGMESYKYLPDLIRFKRNMLFERVSATRVYIINPLVLPFFRLIIFLYIHVLKRTQIRNLFVQEMISIYQGFRLLNRTLS